MMFCLTKNQKENKLYVNFRAQGSKPQEAQNQKRSNTTFTQQSDTTENNKYSKMPENLKELSSGYLETKQNNKSKAFQKIKNK